MKHTFSTNPTSRHLGHCSEGFKASCAWGDTQMQCLPFLHHSEVKFRSLANSPFPYLNKALKIWISHWPIPNVQPPSHSQSLCGRVGEHQRSRGDWLVSNNLCMHYAVCNNPLMCMPKILARAFCYSDDHMALGTVWAMDPRSCSLARWTRILRIRQYIVWEELWGST